MHYLRALLLGLCLGVCYFVLNLQAIGIAAAGMVFWWFEPEAYSHLYHIGQNLVGIGLASLLPAYLVHSYEPQKKWLCIGVVIAISMLLHGNLNFAPWDPAGIVRFFQNMWWFGGAESIGVFFEMLLLPLFWLWFLNRASGKVDQPAPLSEAQAE
ncbi:hypothetical protein KUV89_10980 [Marinobacter hydrocarbonoclasticus]|nr:hypothetical protein [Marinobacter nauticus]